MTTFGWKTLPSGRARFSGSIRGWDETGHDTFAVDVDGVELFGELRQSYLPDRHNFGVLVVSFGYRESGSVGVPVGPDSQTVQSLDEATAAQVARVIVELVDVGLSMEKPPTFLKQYPNSRFLGGVSFADQWFWPIKAVRGKTP